MSCAALLSECPKHGVSSLSSKTYGELEPTDQRSLVVIVEGGPGDSDEISCVSDVEQSYTG